MAASAHDLSLGLERRTAAPPSNRRFIAGSLLAFGLLAAIAAMLVTAAVTDRHASLHAAHGAELEALARGRADVLATWLDGRAQLGRRFALSDRFRQFANALAASRAGAPLPRSLAAQLPYFRKLINEFAEQNGLARVALVGLDGRWFLGSPNGPLTSPAERDALAATLESHSDRAITPVRRLHPRAPNDRTSGVQLALDILLPVPISKAPDGGRTAGLAAVLVMTLPVGDRLAEWLQPGPSQIGSRVRLLQQAADGAQQIMLDSAGQLVLSDAEGAAAPGHLQPYGRQHDPRGTTVFAFGAPTPGLPWTVVYEIEAASALAPLRAFAAQAVMAAIAVVLALALAFVTFWWRRHAAHHRELVRLLQRFTGGWGGQWQTEDIGRTGRQPGGPSTKSRAAPSVASAVAATGGDIVGTTDGHRSPTTAGSSQANEPELAGGALTMGRTVTTEVSATTTAGGDTIGPTHGDRLPAAAASSQANEPELAGGALTMGRAIRAVAPANGRDITGPTHGDRSPTVATSSHGVTERTGASQTIGDGQIEPKSQHLPVATTAPIEPSGRWRGILAIALGQATLVEPQWGRENVAQHTVGALLRAIELLDPFLIDHALRLRHYALAVGRHCGLGQAELGTLDLAARLSPIAKTFMPDRAPAGLRARAEPGILRQDVAHAVHVLASIGVDLPVAEAVLQMHERLDGSGHPHCLRAEQIGFLGRILSAVDAFCLQTGPRIHGDRITPGNALYHLAQNPDHYDVTVISALAAVVAAGAGDDGRRSGRPLPRQPAAPRLRLGEPTLTEAAA